MLDRLLAFHHCATATTALTISIVVVVFQLDDFDLIERRAILAELRFERMIGDGRRSADATVDLGFEMLDVSRLDMLDALHVNRRTNLVDQPVEAFDIRNIAISDEAIALMRSKLSSARMVHRSIRSKSSS